MTAIVLATLNARYIHCALGLRYLRANMGELRAQTALREFTIDQRPIDIAEQLLADSPAIIGLGVYIWNVAQCTQLVALIKTISPQTLVVLGGPEVSFEQQAQTICQQADYIICGPGEQAFPALCRALLAGERPPEKILHPPFVHPRDLRFPYDEYSDEDIAHRVIYVEASRGCPFKCEFCLSALDKTAWPFDIEAFLRQMDRLYRRGVRHFKFVDRTFNLKIDHSRRILEFFLQRLDEDLFLHFELIPDHLPEALKALIQRFPPHSLQFEIGIQTFTPEVQRLISRRQDNAKTEANLRWLRQHSQAHLHCDLIAGLPGESYQSFAASFDRLVALQPHEIQLGILKRLRGTPIIRHTQSHAMRYNPAPPYNILSTDRLDFATMQRIGRFARYWDMIANSGRFRHTLPLLLGEHPFARFMALSDQLFAQSGQTHRIALKRLFGLIWRGARKALKLDEATLRQTLERDYAACALKGPLDLTNSGNDKPQQINDPAKARARQQRHNHRAQARPGESR